MGTKSLDDIRVTPLKKIPTNNGDVMTALKASDDVFNGFGEVYFSWIDCEAIKAWKCHKNMTLNLVVPLGEVRFVFHLIGQKNCFRLEDVGEEKYSRVTVPAGIWFGFQGKGYGKNLLLNIADIEHYPDEVMRKSISEINFDWSIV